jgi:hypothetical protein
MRVNQRVIRWAFNRAERISLSRAPDFIIGEPDRPYMRRWWLIPRNRFFNVYLHKILRSDDDCALHDHPWANISVLLDGFYIEHTIAPGGVNHRRLFSAGDVKFRRAVAAHRLEVSPGAICWSLFITGPVLRSWGFHCPAGWVHWRDFTNTVDGGATIGRGCG